MLSVATDWAFEVCALLSGNIIRTAIEYDTGSHSYTTPTPGTLGKTSLAGQSIVLTINSLLLMIPRYIYKYDSNEERMYH